MKPRVPTQSEMDELIGFLPKLYAQGFQAVKVPGDAILKKNNVIQLSPPVYDQLVCDFFEVASQKVWCDPDYMSTEAVTMLQSAESVNTASIDEIRSMLTRCVRGERFRDGFWESVVVGGQVRLILMRLQALR